MPVGVGSEAGEDAFGAVVVHRYLPEPKSRVISQPNPESLEDLHVRLGELEQLQKRVSELEERLDSTERL